MPDPSERPLHLSRLGHKTTCGISLTGDYWHRNWEVCEDEEVPLDEICEECLEKSRPLPTTGEVWTAFGVLRMKGETE